MGLLFTIIYGALVLGVVYFVFISILKTLKTKSWPTTVGKIKSSKLGARKRINENGGKSIMYTADVEYVYKVDSNEYLSTKIKSSDHKSNSKVHHEKLLKKYAVGGKIYSIL